MYLTCTNLPCHNHFLYQSSQEASTNLSTTSSCHSLMDLIASRVLLFGLLISIIAFACTQQAEAARPVPDKQSVIGDYTGYEAVYETAREAVATWMARLPAGPSPKGPGH
ncbi:hypothetical protein FCM35_KLT19173 [Carex littledalei]|uniref:Uncharacterized protein n=1 Tax=Carex littledalei TaxID=544730 RepID=A0A833R8A5_9POAL|nr:hypothetical protein FCM35_KLT19173 [Carex littledalei]